MITIYRENLLKNGLEPFSIQAKSADDCSICIEGYSEAKNQRIQQSTTAVNRRVNKDIAWHVRQQPRQGFLRNIPLVSATGSHHRRFNTFNARY